MFYPSFPGFHCWLWIAVSFLESLKAHFPRCSSFDEVIPVGTWSHSTCCTYGGFYNSGYPKHAGRFTRENSTEMDDLGIFRGTPISPIDGNPPYHIHRFSGWNSSSRGPTWPWPARAPGHEDGASGGELRPQVGIGSRWLGSWPWEDPKKWMV